MTQDQSPDSRRTPSDKEMPELLAALEASSSSVSAFARERGLSTWKLYERRREAAPARPKAKSPDSVGLVPVRVVTTFRPTKAPLELILSSGHRLLVPRDFDESALRRLMGVMASC